jgi:hypothetical protein
VKLIQSLFQRFFDFPDWDVDDCMSYLKNVIKKENFEIDLGVEQLFRDAFLTLKGFPGRPQTIFKKDIFKMGLDVIQDGEMQGILKRSGRKSLNSERTA